MATKRTAKQADEEQGYYDEAAILLRGLFGSSGPAGWYVGEERELLGFKIKFEEMTRKGEYQSSRHAVISLSKDGKTSFWSIEGSEDSYGSDISYNGSWEEVIKSEKVVVEWILK